MTHRSYFFYYLILLCFCDITAAQDVVIDSIVLDGNKRTKAAIIFRELDIAVGDTLSLETIDEDLLRNKKRLLSTGLFNIVIINIKNQELNPEQLVLHFDLKENWYIYPSVIWEYADRDFNVWWKEHRFDFSRTNYGVRLDHLNTTGHKDRLKIKLQTGYTRKYELLYTFPYFLGSWGLGGEFLLSQNKEIGYINNNNSLLFYKHPDERILLQRIRGGLSLTNRVDAYNFHSIRLEFHDNSIDNVIALDKNSNYFLDGVNRNRFFYAEYDYQLDKRVFPTYPEGGYALSFNIKKYGLGIFKDYNNLSVSVAAEKYFALAKNLVFGGRLKLKGNLIRNTLGFANNTGFGYGDQVSGYELYVVDGSDFVISNTSLKLRLFERIYNIKRYMFIDQFDQLPITIWARISVDAGYVNERTYIATNTFTNRWLYGGGPAIDVFLYNNYRMSASYSINHLGQGALFLNGGFYF